MTARQDSDGGALWAREELGGTRECDETTNRRIDEDGGGGGGSYSQVAGWPVAAMTEDQREPSGSTVLRRTVAAGMGTWT